MKSTKKSLFLSTISLVLCFAMLLGTTWAWFTDEVTSGVNRIQAGNLDIDLLMDKTNGGTAASYVSIAGGQGDIFKEADKAQNSNATLWEPGKTQFAKLAVENKGNLAVKYTAYIDVTDNGLANALECALITAKAPISTDNYNNWAAVKAALPAEAIHPVTAGRNTIATGVLDEIINGEANERDYVLLAVHMKEEAGNEYQGKDCIIDVTIVATQKDAESDAFDNQYDAGASTNEPAKPIHESIVTSTSVKTETSDTLTFTATGDVKSASLAKSSAAALFTEDESNDASKDMLLNLNVDTTSVTESSVTYDLTLFKTITTTIGEVTTEGEPTKVTETLTTFLTATLDIGTGLKNVKVTHSGNEMTAMTSANQTTDIGENGGYYYDASTGILTIKSKSFSPFKVMFDVPESDVKISKEGTADVYMTLAAFRDSVNDGNSYAGYTVTLMKDVDLNNVAWTPIGTATNPFSGVFNGNNKTVLNYQLTAKNHEGTGLFGRISGTANVSFDSYDDVWNYETGIFNTTNITEDKYTCVVKNLKVADVVVNYGTANEYNSPVIGYVKNAYVSDISVKGNTTIKAKYGGGIAGYSEGNNVFNNCSTDSTVKFFGGEDKSGHYGGIVAGAMNQNWFVIENCTNNASVAASYGHIGGIAGNISNKSIIAYNCVNNGNITAAAVHNCGGIAGQAFGGFFINCTNNGKLSGNILNNNAYGSFGGIVADSHTMNQQTANFIDCTNNGDITVNGYAKFVGGIIGNSPGGANFYATNCQNTGELTWGQGECYQINKDCPNVTIKDKNCTLAVLQNEIDTGFSGISGSGILTLKNIIITDETGALVIPNRVTGVVLDKAYFNEIQFKDADTAQSVSITVHDATVEVKNNYEKKSVTFIGNGNTITVNGTLASLGISGASSVTVNANLSGSLNFSGTGTTTATISEGKTVHCVRFLGTGNYTVNNYGTVTNEGGGGHVIYTESPCTITVNNHGTIRNRVAGATYALLFYGGCDATVNQYPNSTIDTNDGAKQYGYKADGSAHSVVVRNVDESGNPIS